MSSPAAVLPYPPADFLARWMPSSSRAGVILTPPPDLIGSPYRNPSAAGAAAAAVPDPDPEAGDSDSFAPLSASADSSYVDAPSEVVGRGGRLSGRGSLPPRRADGEMDGAEEEEEEEAAQLPLVIKLEQLRKWQQHMQEQLKAHQLEELLRLQEEQQKLLGMMNGSQLHRAEYKESLRIPGAEWAENTLSTVSDHERSYSPPVNSRRGPTSPDCGPRHEQPRPRKGGQEWLHIGENQEAPDDEEEGSWISDGDQEEIADHQEHHDRSPSGRWVSPTGGSYLTGGSDSQDRPIKPGISGQKQTFEEFLEEQLKLEERRPGSDGTEQSQNGADAVQSGPPKRAFLRRGEGLKRFTGNQKAFVPKERSKKDPKPQGQARVISRSNSAPAAILKSSANAMQRPPVQRKTAVLNKENRLRGTISPPQDVRGEGKAVRTRILGSHQRQNTDGAEPVQTTKHSQPGQVKEQTSRKSGPPLQTAGSRAPHNAQMKSVAKQAGMSAAPPKAGDDVAIGKSCGPREELPAQSQGGGGREADPALWDSLELSFQERLRRWECDRQVENMELGEFELLEQAAEELSFSSNSSFVVKVLQMDRQQWKQQGADSLHQRRLSSTPIKSPPKGDSQRSGGGETSATSRTRDDGGQRHGGRQSHRAAASPDDDLSESEDEEAVANPPPGAARFPAPPNPPYDRRTYQDEDSRGGGASDGTGGDGGETDCVLSDLDDSTMVEDAESQQGEVVFDDDDTWNEPEDATVCTAGRGGGASPVAGETAQAPSLPAVQRAAGGKVSGGPCGDKPDPPPPPPASQLMTKLFPSLKPKTQNAPLPAVSSAASEPAKAEETAQQIQSRQLRERLAELELEIERFKRENAALAKLRQDNERNQDELRKERLEFERARAEETVKFEEYKKEENRKLLKERKLFEKHASAARAIPDKKEREEIQALKEQLSSLQEEMKKKESRWSASNGRLRKQIDTLSQENTSLRDEVRMLEKLRLGALKRSSIPPDADKDKDAKDATSVTKGVKFASPLDSRGTGNSSKSGSPPQSGCAAGVRGGLRETSHPAAGMKSSLRRSSGPALLGSCFSAPSKRTEEKPAPARKSCDKVPIQERPQTDPSPPPPPQKRDDPPNKSECDEAKEPEAAQEVVAQSDWKIEKLLPSGDRLIIFPNGTRKEVSADGLTVKVTFFNGDTKQISADQRVIYYYADAQTTHTTYPDGLEVLHFRNNQTEKHFPDGRKEITFPDQTVKTLFPNGSEESVLTDGTIIYVSTDGVKEIHFNTGQKEVHTADYKRREYPDGTVKTVYADGRQETRYPTGRLRIKDKEGNVIMDDSV